MAPTRRDIFLSLFPVSLCPFYSLLPDDVGRLTGLANLGRTSPLFISVLAAFGEVRVPPRPSQPSRALGRVASPDRAAGLASSIPSSWPVFCCSRSSASGAGPCPPGHVTSLATCCLRDFSEAKGHCSLLRDTEGPGSSTPGGSPQPRERSLGTQASASRPLDDSPTYERFLGFFFLRSRLPATVTRMRHLFAACSPSHSHSLHSLISASRDRLPNALPTPKSSSPSLL